MVTLENRIFIDAQRARDARSARLEQVRASDPGRWMQLTGGFGLAIDLLIPPPVGLVSAAAVGFGWVGHALSNRRAEELERLSADGNAHVFFSYEHDVLYRADSPYLPRSVQLDGVTGRYHPEVFITSISGTGYGTRVHARIGDERIETLSCWDPSPLAERSRADLITVGSSPLIIRSYPLDG